MARLSKVMLKQELNELGLSQFFDLHVFEKIDSTNAWLLENLVPTAGLSTVCVANEQTVGSGRSGRTWYSPAGKNIYFSYSQALESSIQDFSPLSLVIGLVVKRALKKLEVSGLALKWPNDILRNNKKLAGILIAVKTVSQQRYLVIGIGINVSMQENTKALSEIGCNDLTGTGLEVKDREKIIAMILAESSKAMVAFIEHGFSAFRDEWNNCDAWNGKHVQILDQGKVVVSGIESGVDKDGRLQIQAEQMYKVSSGDVSLRRS